MEGVGQTISYQLGMHPLKIAFLSSITLEPLFGLLHGNECYNMLSMLIGERWKVWGRLFLTH
jgi:hypothetical protein